MQNSKQISEDVPKTFSNAALNLCANHTDGNPSMNKLPVFKTRKAGMVCIYSSCPLLSNTVRKSVRASRNHLYPLWNSEATGKAKMKLAWQTAEKQRPLFK